MTVKQFSQNAIIFISYRIKYVYGTYSYSEYRGTGKCSSLIIHLKNLPEEAPNLFLTNETPLLKFFFFSCF